MAWRGEGGGFIPARVPSAQPGGEGETESAKSAAGTERRVRPSAGAPVIQVPTVHVTTQKPAND
ncbi:hypothetical protein L598_003200000010 [Mesorhizobium sp. J18]|nr:hypothetical protein L598_003200000010 [Mesorhizobium sp. J18]